jgi:hypothetical protein
MDNRFNIFPGELPIRSIGALRGFFISSPVSAVKQHSLEQILGAFELHILDLRDAGAIGRVQRFQTRRAGV